ncbi:MAG: hypothetical protein K1X53_03055 [Candidatus Sumerlaeaceae bacterium]|nr:hypothetical protein [Candidatus Sumerlaeaceae bacterium]
MSDHNTTGDYFETEPSDFLRERRGTYFMINAISKRVRQLQLGEKAQVPVPQEFNRDTVKLATNEFLADTLKIEQKPHLDRFAQHLPTEVVSAD